MLTSCLLGVGGVSAEEALNSPKVKVLEDVYTAWSKAVRQRDAQTWTQTTAKNRKLSMRNRIYSERREYPQSVFDLPTAPPLVGNLKLLRAHVLGPTAALSYFGKVDFGIKGEIADNLLLLHFVNEGGQWKYDRADFINLMSLPDVRKQLQQGNYAYVESDDFKASGRLPQMPIAVGPAAFIAKVYVFCPGREVKVKVNKISDHRFQDTRAAEIVIGGGIDGLNEVQFATKSLEGSTGKEAMCVRVYLMSYAEGTKPIKAYEYLVNEGEEVQPFGSGNFMIGPETKKIIFGK
ncbi:hypothetical protein [Rubritalea marina]|uniref:hypothetical protein n=1 Tax=Rubritalea marina TaxID=361055 RepID=UPI0012E9992A|nr:hypothetical protein [Rubritalea marina]